MITITNHMDKLNKKKGEGRNKKGKGKREAKEESLALKLMIQKMT
jgi:hypothetical protein